MQASGCTCHQHSCECSCKPVWLHMQPVPFECNASEFARETSARTMEMTQAHSTIHRLLKVFSTRTEGSLPQLASMTCPPNEEYPTLVSATSTSRNGKHVNKAPAAVPQPLEAPGSRQGPVHRFQQSPRQVKTITPKRARRWNAIARGATCSAMAKEIRDTAILLLVVQGLPQQRG